MNTNMYDHPSTQNSLKKLASWGIIILPTEEGYLACGDIGNGKLLTPDLIYDHIVDSVVPRNKRKKVLITSGGTKENIDNIRSITNMSTGSTGSTIAEYFCNNDYSTLSLIHLGKRMFSLVALLKRREVFIFYIIIIFIQRLLY